MKCVMPDLLNVPGTKHTRSDAIRELKIHTMPCWWPLIINNRRTIDWDGVIGELEALLSGANDRLAYNQDRGEVWNITRMLRNAKSMARQDGWKEEIR